MVDSNFQAIDTTQSLLEEWDERSEMLKAGKFIPDEDTLRLLFRSWDVILNTRGAAIDNKVYKDRKRLFALTRRNYRLVEPPVFSMATQLGHSGFTVAECDAMRVKLIEIVRIFDANKLRLHNGVRL